MKANTQAQESRKTIYLTLDMDMNGKMYNQYLKQKTLGYDPSLLTYLKENNVKATFFLSGLFVKAYPETIKDLASTKLFSFQNHSYDESSFVPHCYWLKTLESNKAKIDQISKTEDIIKQATGQTAVYFRFPGICHNKEADNLVTGLGFKVDNGTIISGDPFNNNTEKMVKTIMNQAREKAVIIMHVGGHNSPKSLDVLKQIVPELRVRGYEFGER